MGRGPTGGTEERDVRRGPWSRRRAAVGHSPRTPDSRNGRTTGRRGCHVSTSPEVSEGQRETSTSVTPLHRMGVSRPRGEAHGPIRRPRCRRPGGGVRRESRHHVSSPHGTSWVSFWLKYRYPVRPSLRCLEQGLRQKAKIFLFTPTKAK